MSWLDDPFGSSPSQEPGGSPGELGADQAMREHDEALGQLRADRKLNQLLGSQAAERASTPFDPAVSTRTDQLLLGAPAAPDLMGKFVHDSPFDTTSLRQ